MMKKLSLVLAFALTLALFGCGDKEKVDLPKNELAYENKENSELIPDGEVVEHGDVKESRVEDELPSEDELGEYKEILLEGDIMEDGNVAGWVLAISLKDITVNTYNVITTYEFRGNAKNCVDFVKPGDAVLVTPGEDPDGTKFATEVSRIRMEDSPVTKDELAEQYLEYQKEQEEAQANEQPEDEGGSQAPADK